MTAMAPIDKMLECVSAVVMTGGSSGIGKSFIEHIGRLRSAVRFCNLSRREPEINVPQLNLRHIPCDLSNRVALSEVTPQVLDFLNRDVPEGQVILINNSGFGGYGRFPEPSTGHHLAMLDVNVGAVMQLTAALLPVMKRRGGAVVTVASTAGFQPTPYLAVYGATKAFVLHWSLALNEELRGSGVRTLAVCPGPTETDFHRRAGLATGAAARRGQTSDEVVTEALRALAAGRAQVVTGWKNRLMVAVSSKLPKPWVARIGARVLARTRLPKAAS